MINYLPFQTIDIVFSLRTFK